MTWGRAKAEEWSFILFRYEAAHSITGEVLLLTGVASQHMWTALIRCCLQCLWQRWQTSLCASEKPERHNAEWKFGEVRTVGVCRLLISLFLQVGRCCTRGGEMVWATGRLPEWVRDSVSYLGRKPGTLQHLTTQDFYFSNFLAHTMWLWVTKVSFFLFFFWTSVVRSLVCTMLRAFQLKNAKQQFNGYVLNFTVLCR